jgi:hypothetical protein
VTKKLIAGAFRLQRQQDARSYLSNLLQHGQLWNFSPSSEECAGQSLWPDQPITLSAAERSHDGDSGFAPRLHSRFAFVEDEK